MQYLKYLFSCNLGGLAETPLHGGLVGPTFACIIGIQFRNLRKCDRFWYEGGNPLTRFTESQLAEIRKVTLSKLMCDNCDQISSVQRGMFDIPDPFLNPRVPCDALPGINLEFWKERISCSVQDINIGIFNQNMFHFSTILYTCNLELVAYKLKPTYLLNHYRNW